ncbi:MAG: ArsR/SmtB family transcription factor [Elusimicrobiota bacterium]
MNYRPETIFKAFADSNRLRILHLLKKRRVCVCDLVDSLRIPQARVSRHLATLKKSGLVEYHKEGLWIYYSLAKPRNRLTQLLISCAAECFGDFPQFKKDTYTFNKLSTQKNLARCR